MPFALRPLKAADIPQAVEIERAAFPSQLPPTHFRREMANGKVSYLVAWRPTDQPGQATASTPDPAQAGSRVREGLVDSLVRNARYVLQGRQAVATQGQDLIAGFLGTWHMADEAHIVSVGVRAQYKGQGIGELLLIGALEQAINRGAEVATLEVRKSNDVAKNLYLKYGFREHGVRKAYYADNREEAVVMTTDPIKIPAYAELFQERKEEHGLRWGRAERVLF